ncbi:hypothetical protein COK05_09680 [Bacillus cereus]|uniref:Uncharacterized protein n=1 Tax=Bacillus cereus TaxID=1396 RepID=A0A2B2LWT1_BACCE|nr:hypothetical protein COK05_09680 [Bacillus cereus]
MGVRKLMVNMRAVPYTDDREFITHLGER